MSLNIVFTNDATGDKEIGNYDGTVYINGRVIDFFRVENHPRRLGWKGLIHKLALQQAKEDDEKNAP